MKSPNLKKNLNPTITDFFQSQFKIKISMVVTSDKTFVTKLFFCSGVIVFLS